MVSEQIDRQAYQRSKREMAWAGRLLVLGALLLYGLTLDNGLQPGELVGGDLITHQYAQVEARPSNAPGYPLYTMGGWLWFHTIQRVFVWRGDGLPNPLPILSSYSTLWALVALWFLYRTLCLVTRSPHHPFGIWPVALLLSAYYGVTYFFWYYATTTEQYSSAIAQTLALIYFYLRWQARQTGSNELVLSPSVQPPVSNSEIESPRADHRLLLLLALLCGISLAHMLTVAFIVPPLVFVILWQAPHLLRNVRIILPAIGAATVPLLSYLYVYVRGVAHPEWWGSGNWRTGTEWFWAFVSTAQGRAELGWGLEPWCTPFANGFPALIGTELSWPVVLLGLVGIALLRQKLAPLLYGTLVIYGAFAWAYRCGNWFQVILPAYPLLLLGVSQLLMLFIENRAGGKPNKARQHKRPRSMASLVLYTLLIAAVLFRGALVWPRADSSNRLADTALDRAALLLAAPLPAQSNLFAAVDDALALQYLLRIWGVRSDLAVVSSPAAAARLAAGEAVYSTWEAAPTLHAELPQTLAYTRIAVTPRWVRFQPAAVSAALPALTAQPATEVIPGLMLQGYALHKAGDSVPLADYRPVIAEQAKGVTVTLLWQLDGIAWPDGLSISVRLTADGVPIVDAQQDRAVPVLGLAEPQMGVWIDPYFFQLSDPEQANGFMVILYRQIGASFENVAVLQF